MAITRAQYLQGNQSQGPVLPGQVQGVKQGPGTAIANDGTISVNADTVIGLVKLNNEGAFNDYAWPLADGNNRTFLTTDGQGGLFWAKPNIAATSVVSASAPSNPEPGQLWYDTFQRYLKVYEQVSGTPQWRPVSRGKEVVPGNVTASPTFSTGDGSVSNPFVGNPAVIITGTMGKVGNTITITGLSPYQYVPIRDTNQQANGYRILPSNEFADENGTLAFDVYFFDSPTTVPSESYQVTLRVGYDPIYILFGINVVPPLTLLDAGSIIGLHQVGQPLTYTHGTAAGGNPPYSYSWRWVRESDQSILQEGGQIYTVPASLVDDRVQVEITVQDTNLSTLTGLTGAFPKAPEFFFKGPFLTDIGYPTDTASYASTMWIDANTALTADGCIEFTTGDPTNPGTSWSQGPTPIANNGMISTRWKSGASCADSTAESPTLTGCIFDTTNKDCGSLTLNRVPNPFAFAAQVNKIPNTVVTSNSIKLMGFNAKAYVSYSVGSTATNIQGSLDGGVTWTNLPQQGSNAFPINPNQSLQVRMTLGSETAKTYNAIIYVGTGTVGQSGVFSVSTVGSGTFATALAFPSTTYVAGPPVVGVASSAAWVDGPKTISVAGAPYNTIDYQVVRGASIVQTWTTGSFAVQNGDIIQIRWQTSATNPATQGQMITGGLTDGSTLTTLGSIIIDRIPEQFSFQDIVGQGINTLATSTSIFIKGNNAPAYVTLGTVSSPLSALTSVQANIGGTGWVAVPSSGTTMVINPVETGSGYSFQIRGTTGGSTNTSYAAQVDIGGTGGFILSDIWEVNTTAGTPTVGTPSIVTPPNATTNLNPDAVSPAGLSFTSSPYSSFNGAGTHASSDWEIRQGSTTGAVVFAVNGSATQLTSIFVQKIIGSTTVFQPGSTYFVKVRYNSSGGQVSAWSNWSQFSTRSSQPLTWTQRFAIGSFASFFSVAASNSGFLMNGSFYGASGDGISWSINDNGNGFGLNGAAAAPSPGFTCSVSTSDSTNFWTAGAGRISRKPVSNLSGSWLSYPTAGIVGGINTISSDGSGLLVGTGLGIFASNISTSSSFSLVSTAAASKIIFTGSAAYAVGGNSIYRSTTGTWNPVFNSPGANLIDIAELNGTLIAIGATGGVAYRSTDGVNWTAITIPTSGTTLIGSGGVWFVIVTPTAIYSSEDGGNTWVANPGGSGGYGTPTGIAYSPSRSRFVLSYANMYILSTQ